ncbi:LysE family transporter [Clostridium prolinivorans]|uniref:LysE family transporter n=1 Tax=Clostridium prolinivorans TaxID=2769420 RepID=UPI000FDAD3B8|nr:LysE family transporter [Clostridium prolinivorans]
MKNLFIFLRAIMSGFFTGVAFAIPLGPAGIESIKKTLNCGIRKGLLIAFGSILSDAVDIILINVGLFNLLNQSKRTEGIFFIICGILIIIFSYGDFKKYNNNNKNYENINKFDSMPVLKGFLMAFTNPMTHSFWITISGTLIHRFAGNSSFDYNLFLFFIIIGMFAWLVILNVAALKGTKKFISDKKDKYFEKFLILFMILLGLGFFIYGIFRIL